MDHFKLREHSIWFTSSWETSIDAMAAEKRQDFFRVRLSNHSEEVRYEIRGLKEEEIQQWAEFCASVFSYKANPPTSSYFERHYANDPNRVASLIRVAFFEGKMVASCRLFLRNISMGGFMGTSGKTKVVSAGGIGEVCTDAAHRRRGLSKFLLQQVIDIMIERKLHVSLLHAAPAFFDVYEKAGGYACTTSEWSVIPITTADLFKATGVNRNSGAKQYSERWSIREAAFPQDTNSLSEIHQVFSEQRLAGCIVRSSSYWEDYLSIELKGSLWVLENKDGNIVSWISLRPRGDRYQLREFGASEKTAFGSSGSSLFLAKLLAHVIEKEAAPDTWELLVPTFLVDLLRNDPQGIFEFVDWAAEKREDDLGWMYKILDQSVSFPVNSILKGAPDGSRIPHLIWPADSF